MKWNYFVVTVIAKTHVTENLLRLEFEVDPATGQGYEHIAPGDESIAFYFSHDERELHAELSDDPGALGGWQITDLDRQSGSRNYTIRSYDPATRVLVVDVAEHDHGPAIDWFRAAEPGWRLLAAGPRSWYDPPARASKHVLAADLAALPALARILDDTPADVPVTVIAETLHPSDIGYLGERPNTEVIELLGSGNGSGPSALTDALKNIDLPTDAYLWLAGEASDTRAAKKHLRALGWARGQADIVGYWRLDADEWRRRFEASGGDRIRAVYNDALAAGKSAEEASDLYEKALESAGL